MRASAFVITLLCPLLGKTAYSQSAQPTQPSVPTLPSKAVSTKSENPPRNTNEKKPKEANKTKVKTSVAKDKSAPNTEEVKTLEPRIESGWTLLLGINGGVISESNVDAPEGHKPHRGTAFGGYLLMGRYQKKAAFDFGLGWSYSRLRGEEPDIPSGQLVDTIVATQAGILLGAARYRVSDFFEAGMALSQWFSPDLSFSSYESTPKTATFIGAELVFVSVQKEQVFRARISATYDLTVPKRQMAIYALGFDFGLPLLKNDQLIKRTSVIQTERVVKESEKTVTTAVPVNIQIVQTALNPRLVKFREGTAFIETTGDAYFSRLSSAIVSVNAKYESLIINVQMSETAELQKGAELVKQRANAIGQKLRIGGVAGERIRLRGTLDKELKSEGNIPAMRMELHFVGANDRTSIEQAIEGVNRQFAMPDTCAGGECK